jgi:restriction endonuclease S subunit
MLSLKDREWSDFLITEIFDISPGKRLIKADMKEGNRPFVGATDSNNGITNFVSNTNTSLDSNILGVNYNGSVVETFYHSYECVFSDDVKRFKVKNTPNEYIYLFLKTTIVQQKAKYAYGYKFNEQRMSRQSILLPVDKKGNPDWRFMENYIREREKFMLEQYTLHIGRVEVEKKVIPLKKKEWGEFRFDEIFTKIQRGKRLKKDDHRQGKTPYVSSTAFNNGVDNFISNNVGVRKFEDCLTIANSGSVGKAFYHSYTFVASDHVTQLKNETFSRYIYLFLSPIVSRLEEKYSFNREINDVRINREILLLPIDKKGNPDWAYMERYAKSLMAGQLQAYLSYANKRLAK